MAKREHNTPGRKVFLTKGFYSGCPKLKFKILIVTRQYLMLKVVTILQLLQLIEDYVCPWLETLKTFLGSKLPFKKYIV